MGINLLPEIETVKSLKVNAVIKKAITYILCSIFLITLITVYFSLKAEAKKSAFKQLGIKFKNYTELQKSVKNLRENLTFINNEANLISNKL